MPRSRRTNHVSTCYHQWVFRQKCATTMLLLATLLALSFKGVYGEFPLHTISEDGTITLSQNDAMIPKGGRDESIVQDDKDDDEEMKQPRLPTPTIREQQQRNLQRVSFNTGTLRVLVLLTRWTDHPNNLRPLIPREDIDILFNAPVDQVDVNDDILIKGSVNRYFQISSYGQMNVEAIIADDWVTADNTELFYSQFGDRGSDPQLQNAMQNSLNALDNSGFDFSIVDQDNDGVIDLTVFMHSGYDGVTDNIDCETNRPGNERIRSHARTAATQSEFVSSSGGIRLGPYAVASAYRGACNGNIARLGVLVHEMFHPFGLPDFYDRDQFAVGNLGGIANFDIMANPNGQRGGQGTPGHLSAYSKIYLGWITPTEITTDGTYRLAPQETTPEVYRISEGFPNNEYLLLENRQAIQDDFDEDMYEPGGVLIYHVDDNLLITVLRFNEPAGHPNQPGWPGNGNHYPVALLAADGNYDLEQGINNGDEGDFYNSPEQCIEPNGASVYNANSNWPNTDSYAFGNIQTTGISICNFQFVEGTNPREITFDVTGLRQVDTEPDTPAPTPDTPAPTPTPDTPAPTPTPDTPEPSSVPSSIPSDIPTPADATADPTATASASPTAVESEVPTTFNTMFPSMFPTMSPTNVTLAPSTMTPTTTSTPTAPPITLGPLPPVPQPNIPVNPRPKGLLDFPLRRPGNGLAPTILIKPTPNPTLPPLAPIAPPPPPPPPVPKPYTYYYYACAGNNKGKGDSKNFGGGDGGQKCKKKIRRQKRPYMPTKQALKFPTKGGSSSKDGKGKGGGGGGSFYDFHSYRKGPQPKGEP